MDAKLKNLAQDTGRRFEELRRQFLYQRFLARVFRDESQWVLKGGIGLLTRLPGARYSRDVDLLHLTANPTAAAAELRAIGRQELGDHLRFEITNESVLSIDDAVRVTTDVYTGVAKWESFGIDVSCERHFVGAIESVQPTPIVDIRTVPRLPTFRLYPLIDQIADKVAAMFETHGGAPSNRYRDLVDLALLVGTQTFDAAPLLTALQARVRTARSPVVLPLSIKSPGDGWATGYRGVAVRSSLSADLHALDRALAFVGDCFNPILDGTITSGSWSPDARSWR